TPARGRRAPARSGARRTAGAAATGPPDARDARAHGAPSTAGVPAPALLVQLDLRVDGAGGRRPDGRVAHGRAGGQLRGRARARVTVLAGAVLAVAEAVAPAVTRVVAPAAPMAMTVLAGARRPGGRRPT